MGTFTGSLQYGWAAMVRVRLTPPHRGGIPVVGVGLIDTGANPSCIDKKTAQVHRFRPMNNGQQRVRQTAAGPAPSLEFLAKVDILDIPGCTFTIPVLDFPADVLDLDGSTPQRKLVALIGCDVLGKGHFKYDGLNHGFTLNIP